MDTVVLRGSSAVNTEPSGHLAEELQVCVCVRVRSVPMCVFALEL